MEPARQTCAACGKSGKLRIYGCPLKQITPDVWEAMPAFDFADDGLMPVSGGVLDQSDSFLDAYALRRSIKAALTPDPRG